MDLKRGAGQKDVRIRDGEMALPKFLRNQRGGFNDWAFASIDNVRDNLIQAEVKLCQVVLVIGDVADTLRQKKNVPDSISVLRLETDWYGSTLLEMRILYPKVSQRGVLIVDDYGHWSGAQLAVDEYFEMAPEKPLLNVVYSSGARSAVKV